MPRARVWKSRVTIICPACREIEQEIGYTGIAGEHEVPFGSSTGWTFDGNVEMPTLSPSLLRTCEYGTPDSEPKKLVCHSFVRNGRIEYLGDCTHALAGQTVDLPEISLCT